MKAYLISSGSYSDYGVIAIYSTREAAEAVAARHDGCEVEEYDLDPGVLRARDGYFRFHVQMDRDTGNIHRKPAEVYPDDDALETTASEGRRPPDNESAGKWAPYEQWIPTIEINCWARDMDHAVKIASEHRRTMLAQTGTEQNTP